MRDAIDAVDPRGAHRAGFRLFFTVHELVEDKRPIRPREKIAESYSSDWRVPFIQFRGDLLEQVILDDRTLWKLAT